MAVASHAHASLRAKRRASNAAFVIADAGVVTAWLRLSATSGGISSLPDVLNANPAVQGTGSLQPTAAPGPTITWDGVDVLAWPITAQNYPAAASAFGLALWLSSPLSAVGRTLWSVRLTAGGASAGSIFVDVAASEAVRATFNIDASNTRRASTPVSVVRDDTPHFVTVEYDGSRAAEVDRVTITIDGVIQPLAFDNPAGSGNVPTSLVAATGNILLGANNSVGTSAPFTGTWGRNVFVLTGKQVGAQAGLLTTAARRALRLFEPLA